MLTISLMNAQREERLRRAITSRLMHRTAPPITKIELFLTESCTLNCDYCFVANKKTSRRMPWNVACASVNMLLRLSRDVTTVSITFFGGEPLLEFLLMKRIAEYAENRAGQLGKKVGYAATINGTRMTREIALFGQEHGFNYLLSVDGERDAHDRHRITTSGRGSWETVMGANFNLLKSIQQWVGARVTVNPDTVDRLSTGIRFLHNHGVNQFIIGTNMDVEWSKEELKMWGDEMREVACFYAAEKKKGSPIRITEMDETLEDIRNRSAGYWGCDAGRTRVAVSCSGDLYPCSRFVSPFPGMSDRFRLGNVFEGITNHIAHADLMDSSDERRPLCRVCGYKDLCQGPCPACSFHMKGDIHAPLPINCLYTRFRAERLGEQAI